MSRDTTGAARHALLLLCGYTFISLNYLPESKTIPYIYVASFAKKKPAWYANSISQKWGIFSSPVAIASFIEQMMPFCNIFLAIYIFVVKYKWVVHAFQCNKSVRCGYLYSANSSKDRDDALSSLRIGNKTKI